jgi:II/X family phage/plasmid replication protein
MIDWLTFRAPLHHSEKINGGYVASFTRAGHVEWSSEKFLPVVGSHDARIMVRSVQNDPFSVEVSGNPVKFFQGHNIFGTDDARGLAWATMVKVCEVLDQAPSVEDLDAWRSGRFTFSRVDINEGYALGSRSRAETAVSVLGNKARLRHRGRAMFKEGTAYFGKNSRRWSLKAYAKGAEIEARGHLLPEGLASDARLVAHADGLLRVELTLRSMQLKDDDLQNAQKWGHNTPTEVYSRYLEGLELSDQTAINADLLEGLPPRIQLAYSAWRDGQDLRQILPRMTFYRYRQTLLAHGVDIALVQPRDASRDNVVPLRVVLHAIPAGVPDWAHGTPLYFQPPLAA